MEEGSVLGPGGTRAATEMIWSPRKRRFSLFSSDQSKTNCRILLHLSVTLLINPGSFSSGLNISPHFSGGFPGRMFSFEGRDGVRCGVFFFF